MQISSKVISIEYLTDIEISIEMISILGQPVSSVFSRFTDQEKALRIQRFLAQ